MDIVSSDRAIEALKDAPPNVRRAFEKQFLGRETPTSIAPRKKVR